MASHFEDSLFDAVVCYGGPLSYLLDRAAEGVRELARVAKPGAPILLSVMSLWGTIHQFIGGVLQVDPVTNREIIATGDLLPEKGAGFQRCHLFRVGELRRLLEKEGLEIERLSASNSLSTGRAEILAEIGETDPVWGHLMEMELEACRDPACLGLGSHLIAVCRAPG